jgi:serine/threonine-protein kinase RsbW
MAPFQAGAPLVGDVVRLELAALPVHVRTARLVVAAAARRAGIEESYLDELKLAVGEACTRAVELHAAVAPLEPVEVALSLAGGWLTVCVADRGPDGAELAPEADAAEVLPAGLGIALVQGLVDDVRVEARGDGGTVVTMRWPLPTRPVPAPPTGGVAVGG